MNLEEDILSFMDLLDLDEELIDLRVQNIMDRTTFTTQHLNIFFHLIQYKQLINIRESSECDNETEYTFIGKLITNVNDDNIEIIGKIVATVLALNSSSIVFKSEHLIQQILAEMHLPSPHSLTTPDSEMKMQNVTLLQLKVCGSILDAVAMTNSELSLPFLDTPLENLLCCKDEKLLVYFLTNTVPRFFTTVTHYNILDRIWNYLKELNGDKAMVALQVICCLSNYYLPVVESGRVSIKSNIISQHEFWDFILWGLSSEGTSVWKQSTYLAKRAIDYLMETKINIAITSKCSFVWEDKDKKRLKKMWDNFFILFDSLEEKQSNIVLPSLKLFELITDIHRCWLHCAFKIGLKHDNTQVRSECLHYHLKFGIENKSEAVTILDAINDIVLFDHTHENKSLMNKFFNALKDSTTLITILKVLPLVKWSPVPLYHITKVLTDFNVSLTYNDQIVLIDLIDDLSKIPCNNVIIRRSIYINISHLISNCCKSLHWSKYIPTYSYLQLGSVKTSEDGTVSNSFEIFIKKHMIVPKEEINKFIELILLAHTNIDFGLLYFEEHDDTQFLESLNLVIDRIQNISQRQYSDKNKHLKDAIFIAHLYSKILRKYGGIYNKLEGSATKDSKTLLSYILSMLSSDVQLELEMITILFENMDCIMNYIKDFDVKEIILQMYKTSVILLLDNNTVLDQKVLSMFILCSSLKFPLMKKYYRDELIDLKSLIGMVVNKKLVESQYKENNGRLRNAFYEKSCEVIDNLLNENQFELNIILEFIDVVLESGGYGCLKWVLKIMNRILSEILEDKIINFDITQFINRMWKEIEELKSNSQYPICMKEFVIMITNEALLKQSSFNNIVLLYCMKIVDYANIKNMPLYFLVTELNKIAILNYTHIVYLLSEILLFAAVQKKDNRIVENVTLEILERPMYGADKRNIFFNSHIQFLAVSVLSKITEPEILNTLMEFMIKKIEEIFMNKLRYHSNSQLQRTLQACVQNLLFILLKSRKVNTENTALWCMEFLGRIPHQPFERICLEWYIALYFYLEDSVINEEILNQLKSTGVPLSSLFMIMYWIILHKLKKGVCLSEEYEFVMELFLSHIMGPVYSIRLLAQYLSTKIYDTNELSVNKIDSPKYVFMIEVIKKTLGEVSKGDDKAYLKLSKDYFLQQFDIVEDLNPCGIYWVLPKHANALNNDIIQEEFLKEINKEIEGRLQIDGGDKFYDEWKQRCRKTVDALLFKTSDKIANKDADNAEENSVIQKKYVPWKAMSDIDVYDIENKRNKSELILVASLIDKLPNLGGMARTSEVFGVKTYVVGSLRHLQDKQFQGLSVSAERWVTVEEVRPGQPLKDYLMMKKAEGYSVMAAEQTSTSTKLQSFKFPKKALLLLGNEKEGVPCDLLPIMDHCIEIPQQGVIRSLNVHVTAAIFVWEYARQNML